MSECQDLVSEVEPHLPCGFRKHAWCRLRCVGHLRFIDLDEPKDRILPIVADCLGLKCAGGFAGRLLAEPGSWPMSAL
jgi:hypothetical protein